jgi:tRNA-dihydrouridine synthase B
VAVCKLHLQKSLEWKGPVQGINEMRGRYAGYLKGLPGIKEFQKRLVQLRTPEAVKAVLDEVQARYEGYEWKQGPVELVNYHENCTV